MRGKSQVVRFALAVSAVAVLAACGASGSSGGAAPVGSGGTAATTSTAAASPSQTPALTIARALAATQASEGAKFTLVSTVRKSAATGTDFDLVTTCTGTTAFTPKESGTWTCVLSKAYAEWAATTQGFPKEGAVARFTSRVVILDGTLYYHSVNSKGSAFDAYPMTHEDKCMLDAIGYCASPGAMFYQLTSLPWTVTATGPTLGGKFTKTADGVTVSGTLDLRVDDAERITSVLTTGLTQGPSGDQASDTKVTFTSYGPQPAAVVPENVSP